MEENNKRRIRLNDKSAFVWQQRRDAEEKSVYSNIVKNDNVVYRSSKAAKKAEERMYSEKFEQGRPSRGMSSVEKQQRADIIRIQEKLEVRNNLLRQERALDIEGALSKADIRLAQESNRYVGDRTPLDLTKRDIRKLESKQKRERRSEHKLLPSERKSRLNRSKLERSRKKYRERTAKKELYITDSKGQKISVERLRKLRGLSNNQTQTRSTDSFVKNQEMIKRRQQEAFRKQIRQRDEYSR